MPVTFSTVAKIVKAAQTRRNSQRGSVTRQNGNNSMNSEGNSRGRKRKTKVKNAKKSKRGSQKKRGRRASRRQRGGSEKCVMTFQAEPVGNDPKKFLNLLFEKLQVEKSRTNLAAKLASLNKGGLVKYFEIQGWEPKGKSTTWFDRVNNCNDFDIRPSPFGNSGCNLIADLIANSDSETKNERIYKILETIFIKKKDETYELDKTKFPGINWAD